MKTNVLTLLALLPIVAPALACSGAGDETTDADDSEIRKGAAADLSRLAFDPRVRDASGNTVGGAIVEFKGSALSKELFAALQASGTKPTTGLSPGVTRLEKPLFYAELDEGLYFAQITTVGDAAELVVEGSTREVRIFGGVVDALIDLHERAGTHVETVGSTGKRITTRWMTCSTGLLSKSDRAARFCSVKISL